MRRSPPAPVSRAARAASVAAAMGVSVGAALLSLTALRPHVTAEPARATPAGVERVTYAAARPPVVARRPPEAPAPAAAVARQAPPRIRAGVGPDAGRAATPAPAPPPSDTGGGQPGAPVPPAVSRPAANGPTPAAALAPRIAPAGGAMGAVGAVPRRSAPLRYDSALGAVRAELMGALAAGRLQAPPLTATERDSLLRAATGDAVATRGTPSLRPAPAGGVALGVGLPGGGPSRRRRARDRAIDAEIRERMVRVQRRADSAVAARRHVDSLAAPAAPARQPAFPRR